MTWRGLGCKQHGTGFLCGDPHLTWGCNSNPVVAESLDSQGLLITDKQGMKQQDGEKGQDEIWGRSWWASTSHLPPSLYLGRCQQDLGFQKVQVGRQQVEVFIMEQTLHSVKGIPNSCQFYLLSDG